MWPAIKSSWAPLAMSKPLLHQIVAGIRLVFLAKNYVLNYKVIIILLHNMCNAPSTPGVAGTASAVLLQSCPASPHHFSIDFQISGALSHNDKIKWTETAKNKCKFMCGATDTDAMTIY